MSGFQRKAYLKLAAMPHIDILPISWSAKFRWHYPCVNREAYSENMAKYLDVHPVTPQPRVIAQTVERLREGALIAYPTDSGYALGCRMENHDGADRIRAIRKLDDQHHFTLVCSEFAQLGQLVHLDNATFRAIKAATPGPYTFILPATKEVPRRLAHSKKKTVGVRIPHHKVTLSLLNELHEPLLSSTLIMPGSEVPLTEGWTVKDELDRLVDVVLDAGDCGSEPTTVIDWSSGEPIILRTGAGDTTPFE